MINVVIGGCMKKSLFFIFLLIAIFYIIYNNLDGEGHIIKTPEATEAQVVATEKSNDESNSYNFSGSLKTLPDNLRIEANKISERYQSVGVQLAVMKNHELVYTYEYGFSNKERQIPVTSETKYRVASLAKLVTDSVFMKLCDLGKVSIDADISDYLGFEVRNPDYPDTVITPTMLMSHTSTIVDSTFFERSRDNASSDSIESILSHRESFAKAEPGKHYQYSNFSVAIIGAICELVTGRSFNDLAREYFYTPLNIDGSYVASELKYPELLADIYGGGGLTADAQMEVSFNKAPGTTHHLVQGNFICSAKDYMKFVAMISSGGFSETGERILSEESIEEMMKSRIYAEGLGSGFGIEENKNIFENRTFYSHTGNAYGMHSVYMFDPNTGDGMTILTSGAIVNYLDENGIYDICYDYVKLFLTE